MPLKAKTMKTTQHGFVVLASGVPFFLFLFFYPTNDYLQILQLSSHWLQLPNRLGKPAGQNEKKLIHNTPPHPSFLIYNDAPAIHHYEPPFFETIVSKQAYDSPLCAYSTSRHVHLYSCLLYTPIYCNGLTVKIHTFKLYNYFYAL